MANEEVKDRWRMVILYHPLSIQFLSFVYPLSIRLRSHPLSIHSRFSALYFLFVDFAVLRANEPTRVNIKGISGGFEKVFFVENLSFRRIKVTRVSLWRLHSYNSYQRRLWKVITARYEWTTLFHLQDICRTDL